MPETFSDEIGDVHERNRAGSSFSTEFRGASDSLIERERPTRAFDVGRRSRRVLLVVVLLAALLGGGGYALWYWSEPIGEWIAGWNRSEAPEPAPSEPTAVVEPTPTPEPTEPSEPEYEFEGTPEVPTASTSGGVIGDNQLPVERLDDPVKPARIRSGATSVRGAVTAAAVNAQLGAVDTALDECWASAIADPGTKRPVTITLRFTIKRDGRTSGVSVDGAAPETVKSCVRTALPSDEWPKPSDGGEATVSRSWTLE